MSLRVPDLDGDLGVGRGNSSEPDEPRKTCVDMSVDAAVTSDCATRRTTGKCPNSGAGQKPGCTPEGLSRKCMAPMEAELRPAAGRGRPARTTGPPPERNVQTPALGRSPAAGQKA